MPRLRAKRDDVPADQEVAAVAHFLDHAEFVVEPLLRRRRRRAVAPLEPFLAEFPQVFARGEAVRRRVAREIARFEIECHVAAFRDRHAVLDRARQVAEPRRHLLAGLEIKLLRAEAHPPFVGERLARVDAEQHLVRGRVVGRAVMDVVRRHHLQARLRRHAREPFQARFLLRQPVVLHLDEEILLAQEVRVAPRRRERLARLPRQQPLADFAAVAAAHHDQAVLVLLEQLHVNPRAVIEAVEEGAGGQLHQVMVSANIGREQRQVIVRLLAAAGGLLVLAAAGRDVRLVADNRLDPRAGHRAIELDRPVEIPMVGQRAGLHLLRLRQLRQARRRAGAVEQAEVAVNVQVNEFFRIHLFAMKIATRQSRFATVI